MADIIYKELSYKICGLAFEVYKNLGYGLREKVYGNAFELLLKREGLRYKREIYYPVKIEGQIIAKNYFDFFVEDKVMIELKCGEKDYYQAYDQLKNYLRLSKLQLGLIIRFTNKKVEVKRILNGKQK